jgi:hypothetical protein
MARDWKRVGRHLGPLLALAVLAGCGPGEGTMFGGTSSEERDTRDGPRRQPRGETHKVHTVRSARDTDAPVAIAHDSRGNVFTLGNHRTPIDFGQGPIGSPSGASVLALSKYTSEGKLLWVRLLEAPPPRTGNPFVRGLALAIDRHDTLFLTGVQSGGLELGGSVLPPGAFLSRWNLEGHPLWARALPTPATELAVNTRGHITLAGTLTGRADFGNGPITGTGNPYLAQYDAQGALRWLFIDSARGVPMDLAQDETGDLYLAGGRFLPPSPLLTPFLWRLSSEGALQWVRQFEGATGVALSVAAHGGHVVVSGYFTGKFIFRGQEFVAPTTRGFALAHGRDGDAHWGLLLGSTGGLVAMDQGTGLVVAGRYTGGEDFGLGLGTLDGYPGATNLYVLRLQRSTGKLQWSHTYPSASALPVDLSMSLRGESALTGTFRAPVDFGTGPLSPGPGANAFLLQLER